MWRGWRPQAHSLVYSDKQNRNNLPTQPFGIFSIEIVIPGVLRSLDAFDAAVSSGGMFGAGLDLLRAARSVYAGFGRVRKNFSFPAGFPLGGF